MQSARPSGTDKHKEVMTMFTIEQIKEAHSQLKSGADFPEYIREIKIFGGNHHRATQTTRKV